MELKEAEDKYLNQKVRHLATGLELKIHQLIDYGPNEKRRIRALFDTEETETSAFQPVDAGILELETHYAIVSAGKNPAD